MFLSNKSFQAYFSKKIDKRQLLNHMDIKNKRFIQKYIAELEAARKKKDILRTEYLIYALFLYKDEYGTTSKEIEQVVDELDCLIVESWHNQHENIVTLLEQLSSVKSLPYIYEAIDLRPEYLSWDDNFSFEVKCVRALYYIGKEKSYDYLNTISLTENPIIKKMAERMLDHIKEDLEN